VTDFTTLTAPLVEAHWDLGNADKDSARHRVSRAEAEGVFFNRPVLLAEYATHSSRKWRYNVLGRANAYRLLSVIFAVRQDLIRVISSRPMSRKERFRYAKLPSEGP